MRRLRPLIDASLSRKKFPMKALLALLFAVSLAAQSVPRTTIANVTETHKTLHRSLYWASIATFIAANGADVYTSKALIGVPGVHEGNPLVATNGQYSLPKGIAFKAIYVGGAIGLQALERHKRPSEKVDRIYTGLNFGASSLIGVVAVHNNSLLETR